MTLNTKTTTRLWGTDPYSEAVAVTQHVWTASRPENAEGEQDQVPDRPWGILLVTADDPITAMTAVPLIHFPLDAPILYVTKNGIPKVTRDEIKRLGATGMAMAGDVKVIAIGAAANSAVLDELDRMHIKHDEITAADPYTLANKVDAYYGKAQNPDTGVPTMGAVASAGGNGVMDVMIASVDAWKYALPATHWVSHMPTGFFWVNKQGVPQPTIDALKRRNGKAHIYVWGGPEQISPEIVRQLSQYGDVTRIDNYNPIVFNGPPKNDEVTTAIQFAKMWDPAGMVGWNITAAGHGFTVVNINDWQGAVASAPLSHMGFHAPLLLTTGNEDVPEALLNYLKSVSPKFYSTPAVGPYNMTYVIGDFDKVSWEAQSKIDFVTGMSPGRPWNQ
ncbi:hypothetical protein DL1_16760 [Thioclava dalianensis]|uniref:Uncharacterized protein n=2 Tax=Thioclava dalianensis TaxID=1185766 RepID=A0A074TZZ9_9RHOB|nr:hypothetical protein DL1_16760 [Thioclava dalianensis]